MTAEGQKPGLENLREAIARAPLLETGEYQLLPSLDMVVDKYTEMGYRNDAFAIYQLEQDAHPEIFVRKKGESKSHFAVRKNIKAQMAFIQNAMAWHDGHDLGAYLGVKDSSRVLKKGYNGPMKVEAREDFLKRLRGTFTIASILQRYINDKRYVGNAIDRRAAIENVNGLVSDVRLKTIMRGGKFNVAVCVTQLTVLQWGESYDNLVQTPRIGLHQDTLNPDDAEGKYPYNEAIDNQTEDTGERLEQGPLDNEFA
jgi:hypothetical protein